MSTILEQQEVQHLHFNQPKHVLRRTYVHTACNTITQMGLLRAAQMDAHPEGFSSTYCCGCAGHYPLNQFTWIQPDDTVGPQMGC